MPATFEDPQLGSLTRRRGRWRKEIDLARGRVALARTVAGGGTGR